MTGSRDRKGSPDKQFRPQPRCADQHFCKTPSRAFPKFESYGMSETAAFRGWKAQNAIEWFHGIGRLGRVDGFDQDEAESKRDERAVILRRLLASECDTLEAFELADSLFDACPCLVE
jgi:hypothetical protein